MRLKALIALTATLATLGGCAYSPQSVSLSPEIHVGQTVANNPSVTLRVIDNRSDKTLGTRGGVYSTNTLSLRRPIEETLASSARAALTEMGASLNQPSPYPVELQIAVDQLTYRVDQSETLPIEVKLDADLRATAKRDGKQYESSYRSAKVHKFFRIPNEQTNEEIINEILSDTLSRLFNDPKLAAFIQQ